jgi:polyribonucleotide nucleotidyltransferase
MIKELTQDVEEGQIYEGKVVRIMDFGAFVELLPGRDGMVHISELDHTGCARSPTFSKKATWSRSRCWALMTGARFA